MQAVAATDLSQHWHRVRLQVEQLNERHGERITSEELYHALRQKMAGLYEHEGGYLVCQSVEELDGSRTLFVWLAMGKFAADQALLTAELEALARGIGARRLRMRSPRRWDKAMGGYWNIYEYMYEHRLGD